MQLENIFIYIPVWLDQKLVRVLLNSSKHTNLHSSMVRLEIYGRDSSNMNNLAFTFQYGQIRNCPVASM